MVKSKRELLTSLRHNKKLLKRYEEMLKNLKVEYVADVVKDYSHSAKGIPIKIEGYNLHAAESLKSHYKRQKDIVLTQILQAEKIISKVENPQDKLILSLRFVDGCKIDEIADEMHYSPDTIKYRLRKLLAD